MRKELLGITVRNRLWTVITRSDSFECCCGVQPPTATPVNGGGSRREAKSYAKGARDFTRKARARAPSSGSRCRHSPD
jgi:hypothetical protein